MRGTLIRLLTPAKHAILLTKHPLNKDAAVAYTKAMGRAVTAKNVAYWRRIFMDNDGNFAAAERDIKDQRSLLPPDPDQDIGKLPDMQKVYHCILHIPDQHAPYAHRDTLAFLRAVKAAFPIDLVANAGDEADFHALSFHDSDPNLDSAGTELEKAKKWLEELNKLFPNQLVCSSNHGSLVYRKAKHSGIPVQAIKRYRDILFPKHGAPGWSWADRWIVKTPLGQVMFRHSSSNPVSDAAHNRCNLVVGHAHSKFMVEYARSEDYTYWGATGGCLVDATALAFAYGKLIPKKPILGCIIIMAGRPVLVPMILNKHGRWVGKL